MISAFDVIGPVMVGPSSSHTAGACRIGLVARALLATAPVRARLGLHGSFAATGSGHATDRALVAGIMGRHPDDAELKDSLHMAAEAGLAVECVEVDLGEDAHPNSVQIDIEADGGESHTLTAASPGGGSIDIREIDGFPTSINGCSHTVLIWHQDRPGFLAALTGLLAGAEANIGAIRTGRRRRGSEALTVLELDSRLPPGLAVRLEEIPATRQVRLLAPLP